MFCNSEELPDTWYCQVCREERNASKSFSICRLPDTLIIHLKRQVILLFVQCIGQHYTEIIRDRELRLFSYGIVITAEINCVKGIFLSLGEIHVNI